MFQLKFNNNFIKISKDIPYWKVQSDIPEHIQKFITDTSDMRVIYESDTKKFYCGKCVTELNQDNYCHNCNIHHKQYTNDDILFTHRDITVVDKIIPNKNYILNTTCNYFVFDVIDNNVWLYQIEEQISYDNPFFETPYKSSKIYIDTTESCFIERDGITSLEDNIYTSFEYLNKCDKDFESNIDKFFEMIDTSDIYKEYEKYVMMSRDAYLYTDNLNDLKNTIYKYTKIWKLSNYLKEQTKFSIADFILNPLYYPQFEYLVNYKLYNLAWHSSKLFQKGKNFQQIFRVDKKYLPFMVENNIDLQELKILQLCSIADIKTLKFFSEWYEVYFNEIQELVKEYKVNLQTLKDYLSTQNLSSDYINEYIDYITMAKELNLDLRDKSVLYPNNLREAHDNLYNEIELIEDPIIDKKINSIAQKLSFNNYEDDKYVIFIASSIQDLVEESRQQKNCVRTYYKKIANNECQVYFMRKKEDINKSFVTIEVCDNKIVQARLKYNELPSEEVNEILKKWEKTIKTINIKN